MNTKTPNLAVVEDRLNRHRNDLKRAFGHISSIEDKQHEHDLKHVADDGRQEEIRATVESLKNTIEDAFTGWKNLVLKMDGKLQSIEIHSGSIEDRITRIEEKEIDTRKILKWLGTWRGTFFMCFVLLIFAGVIFPDAREFLLEVLGVVSKTGAK